MTETTRAIRSDKLIAPKGVEQPNTKKPSLPPKPQKRTGAPALQSAHKPTAPVTAPNMDRRNYDRMRRGKLKPEARLDLHGMTAAQAHSRLNHFIDQAHTDGLRLVLIITGKGRSSGVDDFQRRHGVLRHNLPHWLRQPHLAAKVLEITQAHIRHGGEGAFYVYLRRTR